MSVVVTTHDPIPSAYIYRYEDVPVSASGPSGTASYSKYSDLDLERGQDIYETSNDVAQWLTPPPTGSYSRKHSKPSNFGYTVPEEYPGISSLWQGSSFPYEEDTIIPIYPNHVFQHNGKSWHHQVQDVNVHVREFESHISSELASISGATGKPYGETYLHPRQSYTLPLIEYDDSSLVTNPSRRLSDASTSFSTDNAGPNDSINSERQFERMRSHTVPCYDQRTQQWAPTVSLTPARDISPTLSPRPNSGPPSSSVVRGSLSPAQQIRTGSNPAERHIKRWSTGSELPSPQATFDLLGFVPLTQQTHFDHPVYRLQSNERAFHDTIDNYNYHKSKSSYDVSVPKTSSEVIEQRSPYEYSQSSCLDHQHYHAAATTAQEVPSLIQPFRQPPYLNMLYSSMHGQYATDMSNPPDLYEAIKKEQSSPPPEDMDPEDPDMKPYEQEARFDGDLYTPKWVRGHGNKREGWCGICVPGRWLVLKNSAYWYDKSFSHGISAATGHTFKEPEEIRRMDGNPEVWEGLCHSCHDWFSLVSNKKKGTTWFRHAFKCHSHVKVHHKDAPKRRRESSNSRQAASRQKTEA